VSEGPLTLGTAGHIDHGKTALIEALTGVNTDRLPEERARGISITLGYAPLKTRAGRSLSIIDVPGHERFVRTMVAGSTGIDLFLMVVAADDGVMPQTVEHATVLSALAVHAGVVAVTKTDIADPRPAMLQTHELLPGCEQVACSARTGLGIDELHAAIDRLVARLSSRAIAAGEPVLHIDRSFTIRGHGTVVTGTLWSGAVAQGDTLSLLPANKLVRVRGLEVHDEPRLNVAAGQRVAVNLTGVKLREVSCGDVLAGPGLLEQTTTLDCGLELNDAQHNMRVHVHHGTREAPGRLASLGEDLWQLRLQRPVLAADGDRVVVRRPSPPDTLGGGVVIDAHARRHGRRQDLLEDLRRRRDGRPATAHAPDLRKPHALDLRNRQTPDLSNRQAGTTTAPVPVVDAVVLEAVEQSLLSTWLRPLTPAQLDASTDALEALRAHGKAMRVGRELHIHTTALASAQASTIELIKRDGSVTLAQLRDALAISRKSAQALLEHFDRTRVTRRMPDDSRVLRGAPDDSRVPRGAPDDRRGLDRAGRATAT
jgi:selenocysteine-specific elongation factor